MADYFMLDGYRKISWDELGDLPRGMQEKCYVRIGGKSRQVLLVEKTVHSIVGVRLGGGNLGGRVYGIPSLEEWGAEVLLPVPELPTEPGSVVRTTGGSVFTLTEGGLWRSSLTGARYTHASVERHVAGAGFVELVPKEWY